MRFLRAGQAALLIECDDLDQVLSLYAGLRNDPPSGVIDLVPAARTVLVTYDAHTTQAGLVEQISLREREPAPAPGKDQRVVDLQVRYDGEDLDEVARLSGLTGAQVVRAHQEAEYVVAFIGFAPGFAYLGGGHPGLRVPRRGTPRTRVPAGSVALADEFTGVYPRQGPGGWQLIGRTDAVLWDLERDPPALLAPGTRVRFREAAP